jgi:hypothetical protein
MNDNAPVAGSGTGTTGLTASEVMCEPEFREKRTGNLAAGQIEKRKPFYRLRLANAKVFGVSHHHNRALAARLV